MLKCCVCTAGVADSKQTLNSLQDDSVLQEDAAQFAIHRHQAELSSKQDQELTLPHEPVQVPIPPQMSAGQCNTR